MVIMSNIWNNKILHTAGLSSSEVKNSEKPTIWITLLLANESLNRTIFACEKQRIKQSTCIFGAGGRAKCKEKNENTKINTSLTPEEQKVQICTLKHVCTKLSTVKLLITGRTMTTLFSK